MQGNFDKNWKLKNSIVNLYLFEMFQGVKISFFYVFEKKLALEWFFMLLMMKFDIKFEHFFLMKVWVEIWFFHIIEKTLAIEWFFHVINDDFCKFSFFTKILIETLNLYFFQIFQRVKRFGKIEFFHTIMMVFANLIESVCIC